MDTKQLVTEVILSNPDMKSAEVARRVGVSRQRVHQVIKELGLPPRQSMAAIYRVEYQCWINMIDRCVNPSCANYFRYGGRGIRVCARWMNSFRDFIADMGPRPDSSMSIDRINNDGWYEPKNCRWATRKEQRANQRPTVVERWSAPNMRKELARWQQHWRDPMYSSAEVAFAALPEEMQAEFGSITTVRRVFGRRRPHDPTAGGRPPRKTKPKR